jgi:hypothetical protein
MIPATVFDNLPEGKVSIIFDYTVTGADAKMKVNNGSWEHIILETGAAPESETLYSFDESGKLIVPLSSEAIANLKAKATDWGGILIVHGQNAVINKISLEIEIPQETVLWEGNEDIDWNVGGALTTLSWGGYDWSSVKAGSILRIYYEKKDASAWGCASLRHGDGWGNLPDNFGAQYDFPEASGVWEITLSQAVIDDLANNNQGLIITGTNFIIKKVTLE